MLSDVYRNIVIKAMIERKNRGEDIGEVLAGYSNLTDEDRADILKVVGGNE